MAAERSVSVRVRLRGANEFKKGMAAINASLSGMSGWLDVTKGILASDIIRSGLNAIANALQSCVENSIEFETAMAGVQKTTNMSDVQLANMSNELMDMSERIPIAATELAGLAESAGQLGIAQEDILEFVEVVAAMGVATNMSADDAATAMARFANIMGTSARDYERMGSVIVDLGNNMATTESEIIDMAQNMAGVGNLVGMSEADILAFAAAMSSVGIEADAGASSMSTLWTELETMAATGSEDLTGFAEVAGMTTEAFADMWDSDAAGAFSALISGLRQAGAEGQSVMGILADLGVTEIRQRRAVASLAGENDVLTESLEMSAAAWQEGNALAQEAGTFYETTASQIQMAENQVANMQTTLGDRYKGLVLDYAQVAGDAASSIREALAGQQSLTELMGIGDTSFEESSSQIDTTYRQATALIGRLEEMGDISGLDAAGQQEYMATLQLLEDLVPSVSSAIDMETGAIEGGTAALYENAEAAHATAMQAAELEHSKSYYDAYAIAQENLANEKTLLTLAIEEETRALAEQETWQARQNELYAEAARLADEANQREGVRTHTADEYLGQVGVAVAGYESEYAMVTARIAETGEEAAQLGAEVDSLTASIAAQSAELEENGHVVNDYMANLEAAGETYDGMIAGTEALTDAQQDAINEMTLMQNQLNALMDERDEAIDAALEQVDSVVSGFGEIEMPEAVSTDELLSNLQSQIDYMEKYRENLAAVQEMGLDADIVEQLSDGSTESAAILAGLAEDGGASIDALNAKFAEVSTGKDAMATAMAEASIDFQNRANEITTATNNMVAEVNQYSAAYANGASTIQGIIDGMNSRIATLSNRVTRVRSLTASAASAGGGTGTAHAAGLTYVPYDGYLAQLHRGEMVLTALEARAYRAQQFTDYGMLAALEARGGVTNNDNRRVFDGRIDNSVRVGDIYVRNETDISRLERQLSGRSRSVARGYGAWGR